MRNMLSNELRHILTYERESTLASHKNFAQRAYVKKVDTLLLTISSSPKRITGISEVDPNKSLERFDRFANDEFILEPVKVCSVFTFVDFVLELNELQRLADNGTYEDGALIYLLGKLGDFRITRNLALEKIPTVGKEPFGPYRNLVGITKTMWGIIYTYEHMKAIKFATSLEKTKQQFKDCFLLFEHNPDKMIKEVKELQRMIIDELAEADKVTDPSLILPSVQNVFELETLEDFILFLEDLFEDESKLRNQTAYEIVNMINHSVDDIDRSLDALSAHHDSNRHTLKVKRSALMDLCIDIEQTYKTN